MKWIVVVAKRELGERSTADWYRLDEKRKMMLMRHTDESFEQALFCLWQEEIDRVGIIDWPRASMMRYLFGMTAADVAAGQSLPTLDIGELKRLAFEQSIEQAGTVAGAAKIMGVSKKTAFNYKRESLKNGEA